MRQRVPPTVSRGAGAGSRPASPVAPDGPARVWDGPIPGTHEQGFVEQPIVEMPVPDYVRRAVHGDALDLELHVCRMGDCALILGHEPGGVHFEKRWHLTISCRDRHPTWDEIKTARYRLLGPDMPCAIFLPPVERYVNVPTQDHVFHVWEIDDPARPWETG
jgi:hypothetical protein